MRTRDDYIEALAYGSIRTTTKGSVSRTFISYKGQTYSAARAIWWLNHPDEDLLPEEEIHHIDWDSSNDAPDNLIKLSAAEHRRIHGQHKGGGWHGSGYDFLKLDKQIKYNERVTKALDHSIRVLQEKVLSLNK